MTLTPTFFTPLAWYKQLSRLVDDPRIKLLAFEDRWHFVAIQCCKAQGMLDPGTIPDPARRRQFVAVKLGLQVQELDALGQRLSSAFLIEEDTLEPIGWAEVQPAGESSTARVRRHREKKKAAAADETDDETDVTFRETPHETQRREDTDNTTTGGQLCWPPGLNESEKNVVVVEMEKLDQEQQQVILDLLGEQLAKGRRPAHLRPWAAKLVSEAQARRLVVTPRAAEAAQGRARRAAEAREASARQAEAAARAVRAADPVAAAKSKAAAAAAFEAFKRL